MRLDFSAPRVIVRTSKSFMNQAAPMPVGAVFLLRNGVHAAHVAGGSSPSHAAISEARHATREVPILTGDGKVPSPTWR